MYGEGNDQVALLTGLSYYAPGDEVFAAVSVRGNPAKVYRIGPAPQKGIGLSWEEPNGCDYTILLADDSGSARVVEYASRY
jgi:hypothetical protein